MASPLRYENTIQAIQHESAAWRRHNFPTADALQQALGVAEECGELAHAVLKNHQGIRGDEQQHSDAAADAMGDIFIYMCGVATCMNIDLAEAIDAAWNEVKDRDWVLYPGTGKPPRTMGEAAQKWPG